ncbi:hypothetical protein FHR53_002612 [Xanthomonas arboricola]|uniref:hypothetical protein n=1 Tax=Xanthomonas cannabis TaxID=1885674 RepID=UPI00141B47C4|nr:hypothetical protein [Xanthomonas cannabis]NIJ99816.1 hypothetical protein [Xanthomonas cannabis]NIK64180.1 hypothetical protein [Xanthomonas cannabis]
MRDLLMRARWRIARHRLDVTASGRPAVAADDVQRSLRQVRISLSMTASNASETLFSCNPAPLDHRSTARRLPDCVLPRVARGRKDARC